MDIPFKPITLDDRGIIQSFTLPGDYRNCDFSFSNMCSWRFLYKSEYAVVDGELLIRFWIEDGTRIAYMCPIGKGDLKKSVELIEQDSLANGHPLCMLGITPAAKENLEVHFPNELVYLPNRDYYDYIYLREDLTSLKGKKFQSKRNHINNFKKQNPDYEYLPITPDLVPHCLRLEHKWFKANDPDTDGDDLTYERRSLTYALQNFEALGLTGGAIRVGSEIIAFSFGSPINHNTFGVHVEKADVNYQGAFTIISQEFASRIPEQYTYVNREEDLGLPGLRQAKLSYNPVFLLEKNVVIKKPANGQ